MQVKGKSKTMTCLVYRNRVLWLIKLLCVAKAGGNCIVPLLRSSAYAAWYLVWCQVLPVTMLLLTWPFLYYHKMSFVPPSSHSLSRLNFAAWMRKIFLCIQLELTVVVALLCELFHAHCLSGHMLWLTASVSVFHPLERKVCLVAEIALSATVLRNQNKEL